MTTLFLQLLADRHGTPAGLVLAARGAPDPAVLPALVALTGRYACHYRPGLPEPLAAPLRDAGWCPLAPSRVFETDTLVPPPADADWLAGDWALAPPSAKPASAQAASRALALQLVERVNADADTHEIEDLLRRDATLSYHLLRLVNSLGMGAGRKVSSFSQAILILGRQQLRRWLNLMLFAAREGDVRSPMLLARVSVRARLMELLARATGLDRHYQEQAFMVGMFSLLGALFGSPLADVLAPLAIGDALRAALLEREGELGTLLALVEAAERADFATVEASLDALPLAPAEFNRLVAEATQWMLAVTQEVSGRHG